MGRWEPDARGRMAQAALALYAERGYEQTTVQDIAERAGVTERTYFRHFADKREVLFDGSHTLERLTVEGVREAPDDLGPLAVAEHGMLRGCAALADRYEHARTRASVVAANPSLQERELLKMAQLRSAVAEALRERGVTEPTASLAAESVVTTFGTGFAAWVATDDGTPGLTEHVASAQAALRALVVAG
ncbi:TetR/AcrR family transcriptional regulator [Cellulomonas sp. Marseille-Q8402]